MVKSLLLCAFASRCIQVPTLWRLVLLLNPFYSSSVDIQTHYRVKQFLLAFVLHCLPETHLAIEVSLELGHSDSNCEVKDYQPA